MSQNTLFDDLEGICNWDGMPKFYPPTRDTELRNSYDVSDFQDMGQKPTSIFPSYPVYIISKGRWEKTKTADSLDSLGIEYKVVVEPCEVEQYLSRFRANQLLVLPFENLGLGSVPARNWVLDHARSESPNGRHWILDDNIAGFGHQKHGRRINSPKNGDFFGQCESFADRFNNVTMAGIRYRFHHNYVKAPLLKNTRIYSCILLSNNSKHRWRGKYNEDTDLSLRILKGGDCTLLFTWCYCNKMSTQTMKGGNTDNVYADTNNRLEFAQSLADQHPDVVKVTKKFGRWHHDVNYKPFKKNHLHERGFH
tara:strand:+ start:53 stop:979 length:927 start_codon:yes stop_codon:yes gene_type:complete